jgi:hypothetical protein
VDLCKCTRYDAIKTTVHELNDCTTYILKHELEKEKCKKKKKKNCGVEIFKLINKKNNNVLEVTPCGRVETYSLCCLLGLFFDPKDGASTFLRNVGTLLTDCTASHLTRECCLESLP